jgi:hypothetical protein
MLNTVPDALICDIVSVAVPPFFSVIGCELLLPAATLPKFSEAGEADSCACAPVPVKAIVIGEFGESLVIVMLPLAAPAVVGANCTVTAALCPAASVAGVANPVTLNPVPLAAICEIFTFADPEFVSVTVWVALLPSVTEPNATLFGFAVSCPCTPVPAKATVAGEPAALLVIEIDPDVLPAVVGLNTAVNVAELPAVIVIGIDAPVMLKPAPDATACVTVSVALPEFVNDTVCVPVPPTATFPKPTFAGFSVSCACPAVPVPLNAIVSGDPGTLLAIDTLPLVAPAVVGANFTPNVAFCPAVNVSGVESPVTLNAAPVTVADETVTLAVPVFVKVTFVVPVLPTSKLPKLTEDGFAARLPCVPLPVSATVTVESFALLLIVMLPVAAPAVVGANVATKLVLCPAAIVCGVEKPLMLNPAPDATTCETVALAVPEFVSVIVCGLLLPTCTFPKFTLPGFAVSVDVVETPLPSIVTTCGEPGALSVNVMLPVAAPAVVGANCTPNESDCPPEIVFGSESPEIPNPLPATVARLITTFVLPVFVSVTFCVLVCPTVTFEKFSVEGEIDSPDCVPVPLSETISGEFDASLITVSAPLTAPAAVGAN